MAAQFAAEGVHEDDDMPPIWRLNSRSLVRRLPSCKMLIKHWTVLQNSKEAALLDAERTVQKLLWWMKQIEICQGKKKHKILDRMHRQKVAKVVKLTQTVRELEEAVLAGGAAANAIQDFHKG
ncbi:hypothetical protein P3S68_025347 [Capsicum galapagoense]